jgi:hypothetical protein
MEEENFSMLWFKAKTMTTQKTTTQEQQQWTEV